VIEIPRVVLASASPRRRELLALVGIAHDVIVTDVDESPLPHESALLYTERVARAKAAAVQGVDENAVVIAADTTVVIGETMLAKPESVQDAHRMLALLSGRTHTVYTAIAVRRGTHMVAAVDQVCVTFRALSVEEITRYVATGEPMDKAGSYGIQGYGATIVERIEGDYFAVMGLSLVRTIELLRKVGVGYGFGDGVMGAEQVGERGTD
jgi:septum formation protein